MKNALALIIFTLLLSATASSQQFRFLPDPKAVLVDTFSIRVGFELGQGGIPVEKQNAGAETVVIVGSWRNLEGKIMYQLETPTIRFHGADPTIDSLVTAWAFNLLATKAVIAGSHRGYTPPSTSCESPNRVHVYASRCVNRLGAGTGTQFAPCDEVNYNTWEYGVCVSSSGLTVNQLQYNNTNTCDAAAGCQMTYPGAPTNDGTLN
jgi:hypothetical protein